jgi:ankyrin repeat protein
MARRGQTVIALALLATVGLCCWYVSLSARRAQLDQALFTAVGNNDVAAAENALRHGANPNAMPSAWNSLEGRTLLNPRAWPTLLEWVRTQRLRPYPPLYFAKDPAMVRLLVAHGANPDGTGGSTYRTPLMAAAARGNLTVVRALVAAGADVNQRDKLGFTALLLATADLRSGVLPGAEGPYGQVIRVLLESGADVNARHPKGATALAMAERSPHAKIVQILKRAGAQR